MTRSIFSLLIVLVSCTVFGQENSSTAVPYTLTNYLDNTYTGTGCTTVSGSLGSSGSGVAVCSGVDNNDVWYSFTATTQAVKITGTTSNFDMVIELLDNTLASLACTNTVAGNGGEVLRSNGLIAGNTYYIRIHSANGVGGTYTMCGQFYPSAEVRNGWYPVYTPDDGLPGYKINQTISRTNFAPYTSLIQGTNWIFTDIDTGLQYDLYVAGTNGIANLNAVGGLCFNETYDVTVEVLVDGFWCGYSTVRQIYTESVPTTAVEPAYAGQAYDLDGDIKAKFVGTGQTYEWMFITNNGQDTIYYLGAPNSGFAYLSQMDCIRHNRVYVIRVRAEYCGVWGPWSESAFVTTNPLPHIGVQPQYCNTNQYVGATLLSDFLPVADQYAWQFAPIEEGDPAMTPIGPAIVAYSVGTTALHLLNLGLEYGVTYRVGTKAFLGSFDDCDDPQEGDYGYFCPITILFPNFAPGGPSVNMEVNPVLKEGAYLYPNPVSDGNISLYIRALGLSGNARVRVFDLTGRQVYDQPIMKIEEASLLQLQLPALPTGQYVVSLEAESGAHRFDMVVAP
ncbi:MAG: hypothetical protein RL226_1673 [Bacteroidota bacterium]